MTDQVDMTIAKKTEKKELDRCMAEKKRSGGLKSGN